MFAPKLSTPPKYASLPKLIVEPRAEMLAEWLAHLPLANPQQSARDIVDVLTQLNRIEIVAKKRLALLETLRPRILELAPTLRKEYIDAELPLSERKKQRHELGQQLFAELAFGYKLIVMDILLTEKEVHDPRETLIPALYQAMSAVTERLIDSYLIFSHEPAEAWLEINQIYFYSHAHSIADLAFVSTGKRKDPTINKCYQKALLLGLSDPYHLMPGEIAKLADELDLVDSLCSSLKIAAAPPQAGQFIVDPQQDAGPRYLADAAQTTRSRDARTISLEHALELLTKRLRETMDSGQRLGGSASGTTLAQRQKREMYQRTLQAWGRNTTRDTTRNPALQQVALVAGLSAAHHCVSDGLPFSPEQTEYRLAHPTAPLTPSSATISLTKHHADKAPDDAQFRTGRMANFDVGIATPNDVWAQIYYAEGGKMLAQSPQQGLVAQQNTTANVKDSSLRGLALSFAAENIGIKTRVGDLVAIMGSEPLTGLQQGATWNICAVRWLRTSNTKKLELGIEILATDSLPVATRAIEGVGKGSEYFRGLIIPKIAADAEEATLISMPSIYDVGTALLVVSEDKLFKVRLTKLVEGSSSFSRFRYRILA